MSTENATLPATFESTPEQQELERLRQENATLKQQQLDSERDQRLKAAVAASNVQDNGLTNGEAAVRRQRAIAECPNKLAQWHKIPIAERVNILTDGGYIQVTDEEIGKYFGPNSSAIETQRLKASNPRAYKSYRATAVELGLIG
jgi:hypothetical protein